MRERYHAAMVAISALGVIGAAWLIVLNVQSPGFCPPYPVLGAPACIVMEVYFVLILGSLLVRSPWSDRVFYGVTSIALLSSIVVSAKEIMGLNDCPRLFGIPIPLCFAVVAGTALLLVLKSRGRTSAAASV